MYRVTNCVNYFMSNCFILHKHFLTCHHLILCLQFAFSFFPTPSICFLLFLLLLSIHHSETLVALKIAQFNSPLLDALAAKSLLKLANEAKAGSEKGGRHVDLPSPARVAQESLLLLFGPSEDNHSTRGLAPRSPSRRGNHDHLPPIATTNEYLRELRALRALAPHPNIIGLKGAVLTPLRYTKSPHPDTFMSVSRISTYRYRLTYNMHLALDFSLLP